MGSCTVQYENLKVAAMQLIDLVDTDQRPYTIEIEDPDGNVESSLIAELSEAMCDAIDNLLETIDDEPGDTESNEEED